MDTTAKKSLKDFQAILQGAADRMRDVATGTVREELNHAVAFLALPWDALAKRCLCNVLRLDCAKC